MIRLRNLLGLALVLGAAIRLMAWLIEPALPLLVVLFVLVAGFVYILDHGGRR